MNKLKTIVVVDDDQDQAELLAEALATEAVRVRAFSDPIRALAALSSDRADLIVADISMPWVDGMDVVAAVRLRQPDIKVILVSGLEQGAELARKSGIAFFMKPVDLTALREAAFDALA